MLDGLGFLVAAEKHASVTVTICDVRVFGRVLVGAVVLFP